MDWQVAAPLAWRRAVRATGAAATVESYVECQERVAKAWHDPESWTKSSIQNVAGMGYFSADRAIREHADQVWAMLPAVTSRA